MELIFELGAAIFIKENELLLSLIQEFGMNTTWIDAPDIGFGVYQNNKILKTFFGQSALLKEYGYDPVVLLQSHNDFISNYTNIYKFLNSKKTFSGVKDFLQSINLTETVQKKTFRDHLKKRPQHKR